MLCYLTGVGRPALGHVFHLSLMRWLWKLFEHPAIYRLNQRLLGYLPVLAYQRLLRAHLQLSGGETLLDIGCGTGDYANSFPNQHYIGLDINAVYVDRARTTFGHLPNVSFRCMDLNALACEHFLADHAFCIAVTHHLTDTEVQHLVRNAIAIVRNRFVVVDLYLPSPWLNPIGYFLVKLDRGRYGRSKQRLLTLLKDTGIPMTVISTDFGFPYPALAATFQASEVYHSNQCSQPK